MSEVADIAAQKREARAAMKQLLAAMSERERTAASRAACDAVIQSDLFQSAANVMAYLPLPGEMDCTAILRAAFDAGKTVAVPVVDWNSRATHAARVTTLDSAGFVEDRHHVRIPRVIEAVPIDALDVVIVPALALDAAGHRLGRGGGFYDRFLARLPKSAVTIGLAFDRQVLEAAPAEAHDARVRHVVTEQRWIDCGKAGE